jgi:transposase
MAAYRQPRHLRLLILTSGAAPPARDLHPDRGVRHLLAAYDLREDKLYGHIKPRKTRTRFLEFCRYLRSLYPPGIRIAIICDNFSPHLTSAKDGRVGAWAAASNVEIAYTPTNSSWLNRIEAQFAALRYFAIDGTDHASHQEQASMIRRYVIWRNKLSMAKLRWIWPTFRDRPGSGVSRGVLIIIFVIMPGVRS